jgi:hypothetical protein
MACRGTTLLLFLYCVGSGLCDELITRPEESYRVSKSVWLRNRGSQGAIWAVELLDGWILNTKSKRLVWTEWMQIVSFRLLALKRRRKRRRRRRRWRRRKKEKKEKWLDNTAVCVPAFVYVQLLNFETTDQFSQRLVWMLYHWRPLGRSTF